ncbi:MAG: Crp/Fnr family transcriptional regulator [Deltaproteobacteria bacterium]|jgi:CRP/FNR family transcriptional regulator
MPITVNKDVCGLCQCEIRHNALFAGLNVAQLDAFKDVVKTSQLKRREMVFMEGDPCSGLYIIRLGRVKLIRASSSGKEQIIKITYSGDMLGFEVFYGSKVYAHTAIAMDDSELCYVSKAALFGILEKDPAIARKIIIALGSELNQAYERIGSLGLLNAREKMAHLLYTLANEYGVKADKGVKLNLTLSRLDIAELLGITQETSIRLLKGFKEDGILEIKRKEILIKSMSKLKELGE